MATATEPVKEPEALPATSATPSRPKSSKPKSTVSIPNVNSLMRSGKKAELSTENADSSEADQPADQSFSDDQLRTAWMEFAETRKVYQAEYHLLTQEYEIVDQQVVVHLHNPVQETMLDTLKSDMTTFLREKLKNNSIMVRGELKESSDRKVIYTNREKFDHLAEKNPRIVELRDRLGLDTDF